MISYFGFTLMLNYAIPIALATIAQMFVMTGNDIDLSIGTFVGFVCCVAATYLHDAPLLGVAGARRLRRASTRCSARWCNGATCPRSSSRSA